MIGAEDTARVDAEVRRVWTEWHAAQHPTMTLADALMHPQLARVVRAHALTNIRHGLDARGPEVSHAA